MITQRRNRRLVRLKDYDYSSEGLYFVTICTKDRECLFGEIVKEETRLNECGDIILNCWNEIPKHFLNVILDSFVGMPNHIHTILSITSVGARHASPLQSRVQSLGTIIGSFKSAVTKRINEIRNTPGALVWQRNYYEHVIRNEKELLETRKYIEENPLKWSEDPENPNV